MRKVIVCSPRGFCAGVIRAIQTVEKALEKWGGLFMLSMRLCIIVTL